MNRMLAAVLAVIVVFAVGLSMTTVLRNEAPPMQPVPTLPPGAQIRPSAGAVVRTITPLPTLPPPPSSGAMAQVQLFEVSSALKPKNPPNIVDALPAARLLPDSGAVYGIDAVDFDLKGFVAARGGYINSYVERTLLGETLSGSEIIERVAQQFSVNPRLLIALLEHTGGWVNSNTVTAAQRARPLGNVDPIRNSKLHLQLTWAASLINQGYYGARLGTRPFSQMGDRDAYASIPPGTNAGTAAVLNYLAAITPRAEWDDAMGAGPKSFLATYRNLFGDPFALDKGAPINNTVRQPALRLPFASGERWHLTGGPHNSWGGGSNWGALDFTPTSGGGGCGALPDWVLSMSDGYVVRSQSGEVMVSLDPSQDERKGWAILYMHISYAGRVGPGTALKAGDRIGHPSCEGGQAIASHVHLARKYNGEWVSAAGELPFVMDGFVAYETPGGEFQGALVRGETVRVADESRRIELNGVP